MGTAATLLRGNASELQIAPVAVRGEVNGTTNAVAGWAETSTWTGPLRKIRGGVADVGCADPQIRGKKVQEPAEAR